MDRFAMEVLLRTVLARRRMALGAMAACLATSSARAASIDVNCPGMPSGVVSELDSRVSARLSEAGATQGAIRLECDSAGVWITWFDGSRAVVDQSAGVVAGALALVDARLALDRSAAQRQAGGPGVPAAAAAPGAPSAGTPAVPSPPVPTPEATANSAPPGPAPAMPPSSPGDHEVPPAGEEDGLSEGLFIEQTSGHYHGPDGGLGLGLMTEFWSGTSGMGTGPRLDISIGPSGPFAILIGEGALFGVGSSDASKVLLLEFQAGLAFGAPYKTREGFGAVLLAGAERLAASGANSDSTGSSIWTSVFDLGARGSLSLSNLNLWLGLDGILRGSDFETGPPNPVRVASASFMLSLGCFFPALEHGGP
jgi:hypothetical protein